MLFRSRSAKRFIKVPWTTNSEIPAAALRGEFALQPRALSAVYRALDAEEITVRGLHRIQRVAWSIADLREEETPSRESVDQALSLHVSERL